MKYVVDTHTHTIDSGHAYSTWLENIKWASENGVKVLATTEHGPAMPGGPHIFFFNNLKVLPREMYDVIIIGAGPAGSIAAKVLAEKGRKVLLVERCKLSRFLRCAPQLNTEV